MGTGAKIDQLPFVNTTRRRSQGSFGSMLDVVDVALFVVGFKPLTLSNAFWREISSLRQKVAVHCSA